MTEWEPATEAEAAMRDALRANDQELYFRILARTELLLPVSADALAGRTTMGWGTWSTGGRTHVLAFSSSDALQACLADNASSARRVPYHELAKNWPNLEWWLAVNPGLPIEGYLPAWFVSQLARGDVRLPGRTIGARSRLERVEQAARARATASVPRPADPASQVPPGGSSGQPPSTADAPVSPPGGWPGVPGPVSGVPTSGGPTSGVPTSGVPTSGVPVSPAAAASGPGSAPAGPPTPVSPVQVGPSTGQPPVAPLPRPTASGPVPPGAVPPAPVSAAPVSAAPVSPAQAGAPVSPAPVSPGPVTPTRPGSGAPSSSFFEKPARPPRDGFANPPRPAPLGGDRRPGPGAWSSTAGNSPSAPSAGGQPPGDRPSGDRSAAQAGDDWSTPHQGGPVSHPASTSSGGWLPQSEQQRVDTGPGSVLSGRPAGGDTAAPEAPGATPQAHASRPPAGGWLPQTTSESATARPAAEPASAGWLTDRAATVERPSVPASSGTGANPTPWDAAEAASGAASAVATTGNAAAPPSGTITTGTGTGFPTGNETPTDAFAARRWDDTTPAGPATPGPERQSDPPRSQPSAVAPEPEPAPPVVDPALRDFVAANSVEESLAEAARAGNTDSFLSTLLLAKVLLPTAPDSAAGSKPGQDGFTWHTESLDDEDYIVVFTSPERLAEHSTDPIETVEVKFIQLIRRWPDDAWSFAVNLGSPIGAKLPGAQIIALASWAADVGLGTDEGEPAEVPAAEESAPRSTYAPARQDPGSPTMMQKTIAPSQVAYYLDRGYDRVSGFVHRANEIAHLTSPARLHAALGLGYQGSPFTRDMDEVYVLRWPAYRPSLYRIPYGGQTESAMRAMEGWVIERAPFRGNGFAPGESSDVIAEFKVDSIRLPHGAQIWRIGADDGETLVATLDSDAPAWKKTGES
ncbi:SseB family protein [Polymorphospora sp. NPDC051019]|uniref:SseB family protein n=1 Tax=Polymorphospora sp. NPDC051019 TaxID=3155725 RepID=UPI003428A080